MLDYDTAMSTIDAISKQKLVAKRRALVEAYNARISEAKLSNDNLRKLKVSRDLIAQNDQICKVFAYAKTDVAFVARNVYATTKVVDLALFCVDAKMQMNELHQRTINVLTCMSQVQHVDNVSFVSNHLTKGACTNTHANDYARYKFLHMSKNFDASKDTQASSSRNALFDVDVARKTSFTTSAINSESATFSLLMHHIATRYDRDDLLAPYKAQASETDTVETIDSN